MGGRVPEEKGVKKMTRIYHKCYFCGGEVSERKVTVDYRWGEDFVAVLRKVPAGVCQVCGEQYFKAEIVKEMEKTVQSREEAKEFIHVPVHELQMV